MAVLRLCRLWLCRGCVAQAVLMQSKAVLICRELCQYVVSFADISDGLCRCVLEGKLVADMSILILFLLIVLNFKSY